MKDQLLGWYDTHKRDLPWRRTSDPYAIWVSESMLQQTQVATVIPYWERWMARFPTVESLAKADEQEVLSLWQGLGYYRRCRLLREGAQFVLNHGVPQKVGEWRSVPGVGAYTAGAIASIAMGQHASLVDGNVERVFARLTGNDGVRPALTKAAWNWADSNVPIDRPGDWNQALMELGATLCTPADPRCTECPIKAHCTAFRQGTTHELPTKVAKVKPKSLNHVVWVPYYQENFGMRQIPAGFWWEGMWEFPRVDSQDAQTLDQILPGAWPERLGKFVHAVTTHRIEVEVFLVRAEAQLEGLVWLPKDKLTEIPMPAPQRKCLQLALKHV